MAKPFLKWAGGKTQLLAAFEELFPSRVERYLEPFVGSGAVFFRVRDLHEPRAVVLSDNNEELIDAFCAIRDDVDGVIEKLCKHKAAHDKEHFYRVRVQKPRAATARAARLIYLNRTCFNGLYRVNSRGSFNVPFGRYEKPKILDEGNLRAVAEALRGAELLVSHFRETPGIARRGDFVYFDPPYHPLSTTANFTSYTRGSFGPDDQEELASVYAKLDSMGCRVMLSNSDTSFVRDLYRGFHVRTVLASRRINSRADRRGPVREVVVLNYEPQAVATAVPRAGARRARRV
ncbi:MAG: DNA adenine methylase [Deltaproteobacteria bacterium]|nr:DNA adenine methylase [Deltaproteobacteria bacterium]